MGEFLLEDYYRIIFENSMDAIMLTSPDGSVFRANPAACQMLQRTEDEICQIGRSGIADMEDPRLEEALKERSKNGKIRTELTFIRKDGSKFPVDLTSSIIIDTQGLMWTAMIVRDISKIKQIEVELRRAQEETDYLSTYDYLTSVLNRRGFINKLNHEINLAKLGKKPLCLVLIDLDSFKKINDSHGHTIGDLALKNLTKQLVAHLRSYDILGRYGGDEFIVCLPNTQINEAIDISERLRSQIEQMEIEHASISIKMTASIGVAFYDYTSNEDIDSLITRADNNMYRAKINNNCVYVVK